MSDYKTYTRTCMDYGKYMLLKMQANRKACPCANTDKPKG